MPVLFAVTLFASAALLFLVEPMIAKMVLPKLGGTPAVWNTCMVFFQAALLAGYGYAHVSTAWLGVRRQARLHAALLILPLAVLPIAVSEAWVPPADSNPVPAVLGLLVVAVGLPFFVVSASAPLLQKWFAGTGHASARDPYFLYAASNLGSMIGLVAYPALIERHLTLRTQSQLWAIGYVVLIALTISCAVALWRSHTGVRGKGTGVGEKDMGARASSSPLYSVPSTERRVPSTDRSTLTTDPSPLTPWQRLHWVALAFVPSSMMLGVTTFLSTDIAAIPLIWVVPLALYLLSFILVFSRLPQSVHTIMVLVLPVLVLLQMFLTYAGMTQRTSILFALHLSTLFVAAMVCHGELARGRPAPRYLTEFYLWMSFGGVLGGLFNALVAPLVFKTVVEYPLVMAMACLLMPTIDGAPGIVSRAFDRLLSRFIPANAVEDWRKRGITARVLDGLLPVVLGLLTVGLLFRLHSDAGKDFLKWLTNSLQQIESYVGMSDRVPPLYRLAKGIQFGVPILLCYLLVSRPVRFGLGLAAIMAAAAVYNAAFDTETVYRTRSFFGVLRLERTEDEEPNYHRLVHGTTMHGMQRIDAAGKPVHFCEPLTYYHRNGPVGHLFNALKKLDATPRPLALIGLGTGTLASYGEADQEVTYYEIDAAVERIAMNPDYFTYYLDAAARGVNLSVVMGDARLSLRDKGPDGHYRLIIVDAFSSDAIPVHLITREALALYLKKITADGIVAFHISNRYLDLKPVLANLAEDAGLAAIVEHDSNEDDVGKSASEWVLLARHDSDFGTLRDDLKKSPEDDEHHWSRLTEEVESDDSINRKDVGLWTDDFSNILSIFSWR